jgi:hypothetical protein
MKSPGMGFLSHPRLSGDKIRENLPGESLAGISGGKNVGTPITEHLQRFGDYTLKLRPVAPLSNQEKMFPVSLSEQSGDSEEVSA